MSKLVRAKLVLLPFKLEDFPEIGTGAIYADIVHHYVDFYHRILADGVLRGWLICLVSDSGEKLQVTFMMVFAVIAVCIFVLIEKTYGGIEWLAIREFNRSRTASSDPVPLDPTGRLPRPSED